MFNRYYTALAGFGTTALWSTLQLFLTDWWILFLLPAILVVRRRRRVWFWTGLFVAAWVSTGASSYGHYYLVVMPFWALLAAVGINELAALGAAKLKWPYHGVRRALTAVALLLLCLPDLPWVACSKQEFAAVKAGGGNAFLESRAVARRVAELTSPDDYVFVAGSEPQILCYAKRFSPTRFVIAYPLMFPTPLAEGYQREAVQDLERHWPAVIVFARLGTSWLRQERSPPALLEYLEKLLADRYERVGGWVVDGQSGRWQEPLSDSGCGELRAWCCSGKEAVNRSHSEKPIQPQMARIAQIRISPSPSVPSVPSLPSVALLLFPAESPSVAQPQWTVRAWPCAARERVCRRDRGRAVGGSWRPVPAGGTVRPAARPFPPP